MEKDLNHQRLIAIFTQVSLVFVYFSIFYYMEGTAYRTYNKFSFLKFEIVITDLDGVCKMHDYGVLYKKIG
ncbi:MAG: hypothetical protein K0R50_4534 [Eubacterium sp.]|nr:hypothetical protein [Eubacterium sp.]